MIQSLQNFDPVSFLSINTNNLSGEDMEELRNGLNSKIGQYVLIKFSQHITKDTFQEITSLTDGEEMLRKLQEAIPDMKGKIQEELKNFKKEYQATGEN